MPRAGRTVRACPHALHIELLEQRALLSVGSAVPDNLAALAGNIPAQENIAGIHGAAMQFHHVVLGPAAPASTQHQAGKMPALRGALSEESNAAGATAAGMLPLSSPSPVGLTPEQIRTAYGINTISIGSIIGDGAGQTIAIIDAYDAPNLVSTTDPNYLNSDLHKFSVAFGLPDPPSFLKLDQYGGTNYPAASGTSGWSVESSLDVEWAHAIAPRANIVLIEADGPYDSDLVATAVDTARNLPGVTAISMSFGRDEFFTDPGMNSIFTTPSGHAGVTFLASTGDWGAPGSFPAFSPNVVAVGGTTLTLSGNNYVNETGWSDSGGGQSSYQTQPSYQNGVQNSGWRQIPDVAFDADPASGVAVYDSYDYGSATPWVQIGGASVSAPCWAGLVAIANQLRASQGFAPLDGLSQTLPNLYGMSAANYHDITSGNNGFPARVGYDLVTGLGSPITNKLIPAFVPALPAGTVQFSADSYEIGTSAAITVTDTNATSVQVTVVSSAGDSELLTLPKVSGVFQATIVTSGGAVVPGNGVLQTVTGGTITVTYNDLDDGSGQPLVATDQATTFEHLQITTPSPLPPATQNRPYSVALNAVGGLGAYTWSTPSVGNYLESDPGSGWLGGGTAKNWRADDSTWKLTLPWAFSYYGANYTSVWVGSNGYLDFTSNAAEYENSQSALQSAVRIAPLWQDLVTNGAGDNIFVSSNSSYVAIRWAAHTYSDSLPVSFEVVLYSNGNIKFNYGAAQSGLAPTIGVSKGDNVHYTFSSRDGAASIPANVSALMTLAGTPPAGLTLSPAGVLSGTPTGAPGGYDFFVSVTDAASPLHSDTKSFHLDVQSDPFDHFQWSTIASPQVVGRPFSATLTAQDAQGYTVSSFNGAVNLSGLATTSAAPTLVISELNLNSNDWIELSNVASSAQNIGGWQVYVYDSTTWPAPHAAWSFPAGTTIPAGGVFRLYKKGTSPGSYPSFYTGWNISWGAGANPQAVLLRNGAGQIADFVCAATATASSITNPTTIPPEQWQGGPLAANGNVALSYYRVGNQDHNNAADWTIGTKSGGTLNPGMTIPFTRTLTPVPMTPGIVTLVNGVWTGTVTASQITNGVFLRSDDGAGHVTDSNTFDVLPAANVLSRLVFYNNSAWDGRDPAANALDDTAVAIDKQALESGPAGFANYTSYSLGLNGIVVDVTGLFSTNLSATNSASASDFEFRVGNDSDPGHWQSSFDTVSAAPLPTSVSVRPAAGVGGSDRVTLIWADHAIENQWLQVRVVANSRTGLAADDVFSFGNAVGSLGNHAGTAAVVPADVLEVQAHKTGFALATITNLYDFNRDRRVNATDVLIAEAQQWNLSPLQLITLPAGSGAMRSAASAAASLNTSVAASGAALIPANTRTVAPRASAVDALLAAADRQRSSPAQIAWDPLEWLGELKLLAAGTRKPKGDHASENGILLPAALWSAAIHRRFEATAGAARD